MVEIGRKANSIIIKMMSKPAEDKKKDDEEKMGPSPPSSLLLPSSFTTSSLTSLSEDVKLLEEQSDQLSFKIKENIIVDGAVNPNVLDNLLECVDLADSIVDDYYFASKELNRISKVKFDDSFILQAPKLDSLFLKSLYLAEHALSVLLKILRTPNLSEIRQLRVDVEQLGEEGDNIKDDALDMLYTSAPNIHYLQFTHYSELLHKFDDILDSCEDLTDCLVSIITSIQK